MIDSPDNAGSSPPSRHQRTGTPRGFFGVTRAGDAFLFIALWLTAMLGVLAYKQNEMAQRTLQTYRKDTIESVSTLSNCLVGFRKLRTALSDYIAATATQRKEIHKLDHNWQNLIRSNIEQFSSFTNVPKESELVSRFELAYSQFLQRAPEYYRLVDAGRLSDALAYGLRLINPHSDEAEQSLTELVQFQITEAREMDSKISFQFEMMKSLALLSSLITLLIIVSLARTLFKNKKDTQKHLKLIQESQIKLYQFINLSQNKIFMVDGDVRFHMVNPNLAKEVGSTPEKMIGKTAYDFFPRPIAERLQKQAREIIATRRVVTRENDLPLRGEQKVELVQEFPIEMPDGQVYVGGIVANITELKNSQENEAKQKRLLQDIINASPSIIFVKDLEGCYLVCNEAFSQFVGSPIEEILGKSMHPQVPKDVAYELALQEKRVAQTGCGRTLEMPLQKGEKSAWHLVSLFPVSDASRKVIGTGGILTDIQATREVRERYEQELELERSKALHAAKLASLGEMSAGIAHEINNPLAIIAGSVGLLEKFRENPEKFASKIDGIRRAAARIEKIVLGLKKFSRSSQGPNTRPELLSNIINEVLVLTEPKAKRHSVRIHLYCENKLQIFCDAVEIEQVLINLINNGIDAVKGRPEKWLKLNAFETDHEIVLQVIDSGEGIPADIQTKLFQPFFTTKPVGEGTGLGLSISKGILDQHKATIAINRSTENTCFELRFPKIERQKNAA